MYGGDKKWVFLSLLCLSALGQAFHQSINQVLKYNLLFGNDNDLFNSDSNKTSYIQVEDWVTTVAPLLVGLLIDKSGVSWIWLVIMQSISMVSTLFPVLFKDDSAYRYMYKILCSFGNSGAKVCQFAILMRWFKSQFSMTLVMGVFSYFIPMVAYILAVSLWDTFFIKNSLTGMIDLNRKTLQWT